MVKMGIQRIQPRIIAEVQHDKMRPSFDTIFQFVDDNDDLVFEFSVPFLRKKLKKNPINCHMNIIMLTYCSTLKF